MVQEFDDVAFALKPGETSDLVKSQFGYHIIRVTDKKPAATRSLEESKVQIEEILKSERAQKEAERISTALAGKLTKPADLDTVAKASGLTVAESGFFGRDEPIVGLGMAPAIGNACVRDEDGRSERGHSLAERLRVHYRHRHPGVAPAVARRSEGTRARGHPEDQGRRRRPAEGDIASLQQLKTAGDFAAAAKSAGLEAKTTDLISRGGALPDVGMSPAVDAAAFTLQPGAVSDPIVTDTGAVIVKVLEKKSPTADELKTGRDAVKSELVNQQKQRFYGSYMTKARERMTIKSNPQVIAQVIG